MQTLELKTTERKEMILRLASYKKRDALEHSRLATIKRGEASKAKSLGDSATANLLTLEADLLEKETRRLEAAGLELIKEANAV